MRKLIAISAFILVAFSSCLKEQELEPQGGAFTVFTATTLGSKTSIGDKDGEGYRPVSWIQGDRVAVYQAGSDEAYPATAKSSGTTTDLVVDSSLSSEVYYAVYPYGEDLGCSISENAISAIQLPQTQDGTFAKSHYAVAMTTSDEMTFAFENISSWIRFQVTENTYVSATFKGNADEDISGKVDATFSEGTLISASLNVSPVKSVRVQAAEGAYLPADCYLALAPDVNLRSGFTIELEDKDGDVFEIQSGKALAIAMGGMLNLGNIVSQIKETDTVSGTVTVDGTPRAGVAISDGYSIVTTDERGKYSLTPSENAMYIYYSIPADVKVEIGDDGLPCFHSKLKDGKSVYDFALTPIPVETSFRLLALGDPQVKRATENKGIERLEKESVADVKAYVTSKGGDMPTYAIVLGDYTHNRWDLLPVVQPLFSKEKMGVPCFAVIGNHDHEYNASTPKSDLEAQRNFETYMGPVNYSFDRGNVHIVVLDDVLHGGSSETDCTIDLSDAVMSWLTADLALVDKAKGVILCMHGALDKTKYADVYTALKTFASYRLICGHDHYVRNLTYNNVPVHIVGSLNGVDWRATVCGGGEPMGYASFEFSGTSLSKHLYKAVRYPESYQIRMYRPDEFKDKEFTRTYDNGATVRNYCFGIYGSDKIVANIWNATDDWTLDVFENDVKTGSLTNFTASGTRYDLWSCWYFYNVAGGSTTSYGRANEHMYCGTLSNSSASVKIRATDPYGNVFEQTVFTGPGSGDYPDKYRDSNDNTYDSSIEDAAESDYSWAL